MDVLFLVQLLDYEPRASEQVPLLLKMGQLAPALNKAIDSGDTDLGKRLCVCVCVCVCVYVTGSSE